MSTYKTDQEFVLHRNQTFHFVTYEGHPADVARERAAEPPTWFLMQANKRWPVMPETPGLARPELLVMLVDWLERSIFAGRPVDVPDKPAIDKVATRGRRRAR